MSSRSNSSLLLLYSFHVMVVKTQDKVRKTYQVCAFKRRFNPTNIDATNGFPASTGEYKLVASLKSLM